MNSPKESGDLPPGNFSLRTKVISGEAKIAIGKADPEIIAVDLTERRLFQESRDNVGNFKRDFRMTRPGRTHENLSIHKFILATILGALKQVLDRCLTFEFHECHCIPEPRPRVRAVHLPYIITYRVAMNSRIRPMPLSSCSMEVA